MSVIPRTVRGCEIATGLAILLTIVFVFGGGELALRFQHLRQFGTTKTVEKAERYYVDEKTGLRVPRPGLTHGHVSYNQFGFRGPEIEVPKPPATLRLAFLGSSTVLDPYVKDDEAWSFLVWQRLSQSFPACEFDFLNAGMPGMGTNIAQQHWDARIVPTSPDVVFVMVNDISRDASKLAVAQGIYSGNFAERTWLSDYSLLWAKIEKNIRILQRQRAATSEAGKLKAAPGELSKNFELVLDKLVASTQADGALVVILSTGGRLQRSQTRREQIEGATWLYYMPYLSIDGYLDAQDEYNQVMRDVAARRDAIFVDGYINIPADTNHFVDAQHLRAPGAAMFARTVATAVSQELNSHEVSARRFDCLSR